MRNPFKSNDAPSAETRQRLKEGKAERTGRFEELATVRLQTLIAEKIGRPRREVDHV